MRDTVLEEVMGDLHNARGVLDDSTFGTRFKFRNRVDEAVFGNPSIGVDDQND